MLQDALLSLHLLLWDSVALEVAMCSSVCMHVTKLQGPPFVLHLYAYGSRVLWKLFCGADIHQSLHIAGDCNVPQLNVFREHEVAQSQALCSVSTFQGNLEAGKGLFATHAVAILQPIWLQADMM